MAKKQSPPTSRDMLRSFRDRIVRLEEEKKSLSGDIKDVYLEAKSQGFDVKALRRIVKDSMMDQTQRAAQRETEAIVDVYRASLGMLDGTPLGDAARRRFEEEQPPSKEAASSGAEEADEDGVVADGAQAGDTSREAHERGRRDHAAGQSILQNPYGAGDPLRADWDEGWCEASGSDGMDVPDAWRRRAPAGEDQPGQGA